MTDYQIRENEKFFKKIINTLNENGCYFFIDEGEAYFKKGSMLVGNEQALRKVKKLVSKEFYIENFKLQKDGE